MYLWMFPDSYFFVHKENEGIERASYSCNDKETRETHNALKQHVTLRACSIHHTSLLHSVLLLFSLTSWFYLGGHGGECDAVGEQSEDVPCCQLCLDLSTIIFSRRHRLCTLQP